MALLLNTKPVYIRHSRPIKSNSIINYHRSEQLSAANFRVKFCLLIKFRGYHQPQNFNSTKVLHTKIPQMKISPYTAFGIE